MLKMNWGTGIFLVIATAMAGILFLVFLSTRENIDLVTEEYYPKELKYEQQIQKLRNATELSMPPKIELNDDLQITFPDTAMNWDEIHGEVWIYRASDKNLDFHDSISLSSSNVIHYPLSKFTNGKYEVIIDWSYNNTEYLHKKSLFIDK